MKQGRAVTALVSAALVFGITACGSSGNSPDPAATRADAERVCKEWVKDKLKSPATAKFSDVKSLTSGDFADLLSEAATDNSGDSAAPSTAAGEDGYSLTVTGNVDSENGFGALIRSTWVCTATLNGDEWTGSANVIDGGSVD